ncbi:hypothetical protein ABZ464_25305 [Streptomyces sp. NPDC005820]|uniref:hypothetical protein n=1 Tax=Streptomyces sp. NPDC005820 TaxID=3157069 RepID=UPI0033E45744
MPERPRSCPASAFAYLWSPSHSQRFRSRNCPVRGDPQSRHLSQTGENRTLPSSAYGADVSGDGLAAAGSPTGQVGQNADADIFTGDPAKLAAALYDTTRHPNPPLRLALGADGYDGYDVIHSALTERLSALEAQKDRAASVAFTHGPVPPIVPDVLRNA